MTEDEKIDEALKLIGRENVFKLLECPADKKAVLVWDGNHYEFEEEFLKIVCKRIREKFID